MARGLGTEVVSYQQAHDARSRAIQGRTAKRLAKMGCRAEAFLGDLLIDDLDAVLQETEPAVSFADFQKVYSSKIAAKTAHSARSKTSSRLTRPERMESDRRMAGKRGGYRECGWREAFI